ncbi:MAG: hypothetical protein FVQ85_02960 [Planctomycetes bacterium]|nr:hypothetical protein [Planctomycetota bacterium]
MELTKRIETMNVIPSVQVQIVEALEARGIVEDEKLDAILPALKSALEITKSDKDGVYNIALVTQGKILRHDEDDDRPWTIADFVEDFVFEGLPDGVTGIPHSDSLQSLSPEQIDGIANGTMVILPPKRARTNSKAISSAMSATRCNVDDIASGKIQVDTDK